MIDLYDNEFIEYTRVFFEGKDFYNDKLQLLFKSLSYVITNIKRNYKNGNRFGIMALSNDNFKQLSRELKLYDSYIFNPVDNINISIYYLKLLFDMYNVYNVSDFDKLTLMLLSYDYNEKDILRIFNKSIYQEYLNTQDKIINIFDKFNYSIEYVDTVRLVKKVQEEYEKLSGYNLKDDIDNSEIVYKNKLKFMVKDYNNKYNKDVILWNIDK